MSKNIRKNIICGTCNKEFLGPSASCLEDVCEDCMYGYDPEEILDMEYHLPICEE